VLCPDANALTCTRLKGLFNRRIESELGTTAPPEPDQE